MKPAPKSRKPETPWVVDSVIAGVDAFRRGRPVAIAGAGGTVLAYAVETLAPGVLGTLRTAPRLVLSHARARTLKIRLYTPHVVALAVAKDMTPERLRAIADPTDDLAFPLKGPFETLRDTLPEAYGAAVKLAKLAGLLPAALAVTARGAAKGAVALAAAAVFAYDDEIVRTLKIVARARVPLAGAERTELVSFRPADGGPEHYAIVVGAPPPAKPVLTRLHSECFTGDLLGSLKCDCGTQLRGAIAAIQKAGGGVLLYLAQEGRGIGLINKLRAYRLQDQGFDTIDANERLGFAADERQYGIAARMLKLLGYKAVRLLTNNPHKVAALKAAGVAVTARVRHAFPDNEHNRAYLRTKAEKAGHLL
ncbi:MAG TPA: GTP cyclohydrolase II [Rhizomicrobium sp.]|jgi:GTP cyclohydrolase II|nr:GTP cyclohydrolase II [Rhizomicrobium sp.]